MRPNRLFLLATFAVLLFSCRNQLPVGGDNLPFESVVTIDTLLIQNFETFPYADYAGNLGFVSVGNINDPAFGDFDITGYILPNLINFATTIDTIRPETPMRLRFIVNETFGDTTVDVNFDLYEITQRWRGNELTYATELPINPVPTANLSIPANADTAYVNLPSAWSQFYQSAYYQFTANTDSARNRRDSLYKNTFFGYAIKAQAQSAIKIFQSSGISLQILETDTTYTVSMNQNGASLKTSNLVDFSSTEHSYLDTYNTSMLKFDVTATAEDSLIINGITIPVKNLAKAELILFEDTTLIKAGRPQTFRDNGSSSLIVYRSTEPELESAILGSRIAFSALRNNGRYSIDLTAYINRSVLGSVKSADEFFYTTVRVNDGFFSHTLLFNDLSTVYYPRIVITYITTEEK
jgi:hypothetical protein